MIKYIIIEDEPAARRRLKRNITEIRPNWNCVGEADSVEAGLQLVKTEEYDLLLTDIQLSDGTCFEILSNGIKKPVIFITAFDNYAVQAFKFNSIHYLLKPITKKNLILAFQKFEKNLIQTEHNSISSISELTQTLVSQIGNKSTLININEIAYIYHMDKITKVYLKSQKGHYINQSLEALDDYLPSDNFIRINRQAIINKNFVSQFTKVSSNRLEVSLSFEVEHELIVSKDKTKHFKKFMGIK